MEIKLNFFIITIIKIEIYKNSRISRHVSKILNVNGIFNSWIDNWYTGKNTITAEQIVIYVLNSISILFQLYLSNIINNNNNPPNNNIGNKRILDIYVEKFGGCDITKFETYQKPNVLLPIYAVLYFAL